MTTRHTSVLSLAFVLFVNQQAVPGPPVLKFPDGITWERVFESGLRPKHVSGLERKLTECKDQELTILVRERGNELSLDSGILSIELKHDNRIRLFEHISRVPITMDEGKRRMEKFRKLFPENLVRPGTMPVVMDQDTGSVMAVSDQHAIAKINEHVFSYGFTPSFQKDRPLIPNFMLCWIQSPGEDSPPIRRKIVEPPEGYEWYSLDPKVHTPDPVVEAPPQLETEKAGTEKIGVSPSEENDRNNETPTSSPATMESVPGWWYGIGGVTLLAAGVWFWRKRTKPEESNGQSHV